MKKIVLCGGGTAGHIVPCLALLPYLRAHFDQIHYIGSQSGMEKNLLADFPYVHFHQIVCTKLRRKLTLKNLSIPFVLAKSIQDAKKLLVQIKPNVIFSKGGFAALPIVLAAKNTPIVAHESDLSMGLANKLSRKRCKVIATTFLQTAQKYKNAVHCGSPIRQELYQGNAQKILQGFGFDSKPVLLFVGGSLGAKSLNQIIEGALRTLSKDFNIIHICGKNNLSKVSIAGVIQQEYRKDMADILAASDLVVTRGGSNMLCELMVLGKPSLVIPLTKAQSRGDQIQNAKMLSESKLVHYVPQEGLSSHKLIEEINSLKNNAKNLQNNLKNANNLDGTKKIIDLILQAATQK